MGPAATGLMEKRGGALSILAGLLWEMKLSLYGDTRHCGRAREVLLREEIQQEKQAMACAKRVPRSKERRKGARMIFGTKLDGLTTHSGAEGGRGA